MGHATDLLRRLAEHNRLANQEMLDILERSLPSPWSQKIEGYHFKTVGDILDHCYVVDVNWMCHLLACSRQIIAVDFHLERLDHGSRHFTDFHPYREERASLDQRMVDFFGKAEDSHLVSTTDEGDGRALPWLPAIHLFNHQTHHRGQISQVLDGLGIENDYSSLIRL